ncbi:MAG: alanine dehydrogenase [Bacteroidales bacterium]|nr:alanine dehydrogenase [Bacteroidales bacterium]MBN2698787.1 alanine dehydrogenase [Bacteroidales bacterium]
MEKHSRSSFNIHKEGLMPKEEILEVVKQQKSLKIGVPKENHAIESRVPLTPEAIEILIENGHEVILERGAGKASNYPDTDYSERGGLITDDRKEVFNCDLLLKITPPTLQEIEWLKERQTLISSFQAQIHEDEGYVRGLMNKHVTAVAFEEIQDEHKCYPVVRSMSSIAGTTAVLIAAEYMSNVRGGKGVMLGGISGISPTEVVILGAGTVAEYAVRAAMGLGSNVKVFDHSIHRLRRLQSSVGQMIPTSIFHPKVIQKALRSAEVLIGAMRENERHYGFYITEEMVKEMKSGSIIIDVSIDHGGCVETSELRTQEDPVFTKYGVVHYCVPNIPSRVARTASIAISNVFSPLIVSTGLTGGIANQLKEDIGFRHGVYIYNGILTNDIIGKRFGIPSKDIDLLMAAF